MLATILLVTIRIHVEKSDILFPNWFLGSTAALDVSITSALNPLTFGSKSVKHCSGHRGEEA